MLLSQLEHAIKTEAVFLMTTNRMKKPIKNPASFAELNRDSVTTYYGKENITGSCDSSKQINSEFKSLKEIAPPAKTWVMEQVARYRASLNQEGVSYDN